MAEPWTCPDCTLANDAAAVACAVCDRPSPSVLAAVLAARTSTIPPVTTTVAKKRAERAAPPPVTASSTAAPPAKRSSTSEPKLEVESAASPVLPVHSAASHATAAVKDAWTSEQLQQRLPLLFRLGRRAKVSAKKSARLLEDASDTLQVLFAERATVAAVTGKEPTEEHAHCSVCDGDFGKIADRRSGEERDDDDEPVVRCQIEAPCAHRAICQGCVARHVQARIEEEKILPWLTCPAPGCTLAVPPAQVRACLSAIDREDLLLRWCALLLRRYVVRDERFVVCQATKHCVGGRLMTAAVDHESTSADDSSTAAAAAGSGPTTSAAAASKPFPCAVCRVEQAWSVPGTMDRAFQEMQQSGHLRPCPTCKVQHFKEAGICNAIECGECGTFWNFMSGLTAVSMVELKARSRAAGNLWRREDFALQTQLEREDPAAFKALLKRNGMDWDANYRRGH